MMNKQASEFFFREMILNLLSCSQAPILSKHMKKRGKQNKAHEKWKNNASNDWINGFSMVTEILVIIMETEDKQWYAK